MRLARWLMPLLVLVAVLAVADLALACPNCKEALAAQDGDASRMKDGYYYSILFMMAMPFLLLSTGAFFVYRAAKRGYFPEF